MPVYLRGWDQATSSKIAIQYLHFVRAVTFAPVTMMILTELWQDLNHQDQGWNFKGVDELDYTIGGRNWRASEFPEARWRWGVDGKWLPKVAKDRGIHREVTNANPPQENRVAERLYRTVLEMVRTMMFDSRLPKAYWSFAVKYAQEILTANESGIRR